MNKYNLYNEKMSGSLNEEDVKKKKIKILQRKKKKNRIEKNIQNKMKKKYCDMDGAFASTVGRNAS